MQQILPLATKETSCRKLSDGNEDGGRRRAGGCPEASSDWPSSAQAHSHFQHQQSKSKLVGEDDKNNSNKKPPRILKRTRILANCASPRHPQLPPRPLLPHGPRRPGAPLRGLRLGGRGKQREKQQRPANLQDPRAEARNGQDPRLYAKNTVPTAEKELEEVYALAGASEGDDYTGVERLKPWGITFWSERLKESRFDIRNPGSTCLRKSSAPTLPSPRS